MSAPSSVFTFADGDVVRDVRDEDTPRWYRYRIGGRWVWADGHPTGGDDKAYAHGLVDGTCERVILS